MRLKAAAGVAAACTVTALTLSAQAGAGFGIETSDSLAVSSAVLTAPTGPAASVGTCIPASSVSVQVGWTPSSSAAVDGYAIYRSDDGGAAVQVGSVSGGGASGYLDSGTTFSTAYTYTVVALRGQWTSTASVDADVTTPASTCL